MVCGKKIRKVRGKFSNTFRPLKGKKLKTPVKHARKTTYQKSRMKKAGLTPKKIRNIYSVKKGKQHGIKKLHRF